MSRPTNKKRKQQTTKKKPTKSPAKKTAVQVARKTKEIPLALTNLTQIQKVLGAVVFAIACLVYANTLGHGYALDDNSVIADSHIVRGGVQNIVEIFQTRYREGTFGTSSTLYRPLTVAMYAIEWQIAGGKPWLSHLVNVLLFATTCFLLFRVFAEILTNKKYSIWIPFIAAVLFAVHPIHTEVVANIKSRDEILVMLFGTLAIWYAWKYHKTNKPKALLLLAVSMFLGMFSKENAINFVAVVPLSLFIFSNIDFKKLGTIAGVSIIPVVIYLMVRISVLGSIFSIKKVEHIDNFLLNPNVSFLEQKATAMLVLGKYLLLLLFPQPLICDYNFNYIPIVGNDHSGVFISTIVHLGLIGFGIWGLRKKSFWSYVILFYLGTMFLYSNTFVVIGAGMGERFLFVASFAFCLAVAYVLVQFLGGGTKVKKQPKQLTEFIKGKPVLLALSSLLVVAATFLTIDRNADWKNSLTLYEADIQKAPESARLNGYLGSALMKVGKDEQDATKQQNYYDRALAAYQKAVAIYPAYTEAKGQLGLVNYRKGQLNEAMKWYEDAIKDKSTKGSIFSNYGLMYFNDALSKRQQNDMAGFQFAINKAEELFQSAVQREPNYAEGFMNLGSTLGVKGDHNQAITYFTKALKYADTNQQKAIYNNLSKAYNFVGNSTKSAEMKQKATMLGTM